MPSTFIDTFFACTIILAAALIGTAFLCSTMQTQISGTQDINKESYLKVISDHIVTTSGTPANWGNSLGVPSDFGLAESGATFPYELDPNKITRLNGLNNYSLSFLAIANAAQLTNIELGIAVSQIMSINIQQKSNSTVNNETTVNFAILTSINSKPTAASLQCYVLADSYLSNVTSNTSDIGVGYLTVQIPKSATDSAIIIAFARDFCDDRITSYVIYNFADSSKQLAPDNDILVLSPLNSVLGWTKNSSAVIVQGGYLFSCGYEQKLAFTRGSTNCPIPSVIDKSPFVIVVFGQNDGEYFQEWVIYPQVPLTEGSSFNGSEQNVFSYVVAIKGALYRLDISLGDVPP
jgi:hypothetical protein